MTRLHLPHANAVRLHAYKPDVVILALKTADTVDVLAVVYSDVVMDAAQGAHFHTDVICSIS